MIVELGIMKQFPMASRKDGLIIIVSSAAALALLITGAFYFCRMEKTFADVV